MPAEVLSLRIVAVTMGILSLAALQAAGNDGYILNIYGNANLDGAIDEKDIEFLQNVIDGNIKATYLSDANVDGAIDRNDIERIIEIINGTEPEITVIDGVNVSVTIKKPVGRIIVEYLDNAQIVQMMGKTSKIVGVENSITKMEELYPEMSKLASVGPMTKDPDYEKVLSLNPDLLLVFDEKMTSEKTKKLPGVSVLFAGFPFSDLMNADTSSYADGIRKIGYILDERETAEEYLDWYLDKIERLKMKTSRLDENQRPRVLFGSYPRADSKTFRTYSKIDVLAQEVSLAGGNNIAEDLSEFNVSFGDLRGNPLLYRIDLDSEWVIKQDPDYILLHYPYITYGGEIIPDLPNGYTIDDPSGLKIARETFMSRPEYANLKAVKSGNVYIFSGDMRNELTRGLIGSVYLSKILHPDIFPDLDPEAVHDEYLKNFLDLDYSLDEHGVFVYPPIVKGPGALAGVPDRYYDLVVEDAVPGSR